MIKRKMFDVNLSETKIDTIAVGSTLYIRVDVVQVMSDIWEDLWRAYYVTDTGEISCTTFEEASVDSTPEVFEKHRDYKFKLEFDRRYQDALADNSLTSVKGRTVKVVRGRKSQGLEGKVVAVINSFYNAGYRGYEAKKIAIALDDTKVTVTKNGRQYENYANVQWVWANNCEVINPEPVDENKIKLDTEQHIDYYMASLVRECGRYEPKFKAQGQY